MENQLLASKLRELRKAHGYRQDDVAAALGVVRQTYSHYETGKRTPDHTVLFKLAGLYHVSVDDLMQLIVDVDRDINFDAPQPTKSSEELAKYLEYFNSPQNKKKFQLFDNLEKELIYYFERMSDDDKHELIEIAKIKSRKFS
ncbi:MAG: helix-turn-helix domain-containing protein [Roseburia sp.]|nr:helix-turn-helix domain-containing protein [Lachnospiraceae bacterium]MCM1568860.1 helix-turn-helix domain-containing protein [Roseburia sp.]